MLTELPVAAVSLNELSRRVGLAKSNVLRYFESREAILLELLDAELREWITALGPRVADLDGDARTRGDRLAEAIATTMGERPVLCDLVSAQASVLERNISTDVARHHKHATADAAASLARIITGVLPELDDDDAYWVVVVTLMMASAAWPRSQPSQAVQAVYDTDPQIAAGQMTFAQAVGTTIQVQICGLLARR